MARKRSLSEPIGGGVSSEPVDKRRRSDRVASAPARQNCPVTSASDHSAQPVGKCRSSKRLASVYRSHSDSVVSVSDDHISRSNRRGRQSMKGATYAESDPESDEETWDVKSCISIRPKEEGAWDTGVLPNTSECETLLEWNTGELTWEPMSLNLHNDHIAQYVHALNSHQRPRDYTFPKSFSPKLRREATKAVHAARKRIEITYPELFAEEPRS